MRTNLMDLSAHAACPALPVTETTARAAIMVRPRAMELQDIPIPPVAPDAGLLRIEATGICGSDWPMYNNAKPGPRILGHEMVGVIEQLGEIAAARWGVAIGDHVAVEEYLPCGHCEYCRTGEYRSCLETDTRLSGAIRYGSTPLARAPGLWGGYAEYVVLHPRSVLHRLPDGIAPHIAAMALPIGNGFQWAVMDGGAGPGRSIVIQGPGQQGLGCVLAAKAAGADRIILVGLARDEARLAVGRKLGADHVIAADQEDVVESVRRITGGRLVDIVLDATGAGPGILNTSLAMLRKRGTLVQASRKGTPVLGFDIDQVVNKQILLRGTRGHSFAAVELAIGHMTRHGEAMGLLSSHIVGLADVDHALRMMGGETQESCIHISVDPWR